MHSVRRIGASSVRRIGSSPRRGGPSNPSDSKPKTAEATEAAEAVAARLAERIAALDNPQRRFEYEHQHTLSAMSVPAAAPRQARDLAASKPWQGDEGAIGTSRRMLEDSIRPLKVTRAQRLSTAREDVLDYQHNAAAGPTHQERLVVSKPRRQAPATSGLSSGGWIESVAAQEIENAVKRGQFRDIPRGPAAPDSRADLVTASRNPQLDFTEYLMNNIIRKQGGAPPWILKHVAVRDAIERFRRGLGLQLRERVVHRAASASGPGSAGSTPAGSLGGESRRAEAAIRLARTWLADPRFCDAEWEGAQREYHIEAVEQLNRRIRGYNLQAPATARRGYLDVAVEVRAAYALAAEGIEAAVERFVGAAAVHKADRRGLHSSLPPLEAAHKHYGIRDLLRDLWRRTT